MLSAAEEEDYLALLEAEAADRARDDLIAFTEFTKPDFETSAHHRLIADKLMAVERGEIKRLMIMAPPRHTKSELTSVRLAAWFLGRHPTKQVIGTSYGGSLALEFGKAVRDVVASVEFHKVFPKVSLRQDSKSAERWRTNQGGSYVSAGVGSSLTGFGGHLAIIDDPVKGREEADSAAIQTQTINWYRAVLRTRLMPGGAIVMPFTHWHDNDLGGWILEEMKKGGEHWELLVLPALNERGEALWPEWYPVDVLEDTRAAIGEREWSALYMQKPQPDEGTFFQREWFDMYDPEKAPEAVNSYICSDYAVTDGGGDFTEHGVWAVDHDDDIWITDWWSGQTSADVWIETGLDLVKKHKPLCWFGEAGQIRRSTEPFLKKRMRERKDWCRVEWMPSMAEKATRARAFQARASQGKVHLPDNKVGHRILDQLLRFPSGKHDDAVDVCSMIGRAVNDAVKGAVVTKKTKKVDRWDKAFGIREQGKVNWQTV